MSKFDLITYTNGVFDAELSPLDRGLAYGDGLFETCRVYTGVIPLWQWHVERLLEGAHRLSIPVDPDRLASERDLVLEAAGGQAGVLKLIVTRGLGGRAYRPPPAPEPSYCWQFRAGASSAWAEGQAGVQLYECQHRLGDNPALAGIKHLNRLEYVLARAEWADEFPEGLLLNNQDQVVEGTMSNLFALVDGQWRTPPLDRNGVSGVMRRLLIEKLGPELGLPVRVEPIAREALTRAREVFVGNSVFGIWPVTGLVRGGEVFTVGEQTRQLQQGLANWLTRQGVSEERV